MDEGFLYSYRRGPSPEFAHRLRATLEQRHSANGFGSSRPRTVRTAALAASIVLAGFAFSFPTVRAAAQAFLDLFRVVSFAAVPVNIDRMGQLQNGQLDLAHLAGDQVEVLKQPGAPVQFDTVSAAGAAAGIPVKVPTWRPVGWELSDIAVLGGADLRVTASAAKLKQVLDGLSIDDVTIPEGIDGKAITVHVSPAVAVGYRNATASVRLIQAQSPTAQLPAGLDLPTLGEIGLRILGLDRAQAHQFAQSIDWRTTLVVPVPATAASFRQVDVQGNPGLMIETTAPETAAPQTGRGTKRHYGGHTLLWSSGNTVFALQGQLDSPPLLEMAQSMQ